MWLYNDESTSLHPIATTWFLDHLIVTFVQDNIVQDECNMRCPYRFHSSTCWGISLLSICVSQEQLLRICIRRGCDAEFITSERRWGWFCFIESDYCLSVVKYVWVDAFKSQGSDVVLRISLPRVPLSIRSLHVDHELMLNMFGVSISWRP